MICLCIVNLRYIFLLLMMIVNLWTIKMQTSRLDISNKVTFTKVILNDQWCNILLNQFVKQDVKLNWMT